MIKFLSPEVEAIIDAGWQDSYARKQEYLLFENIMFAALGTTIVQDIMVELDVDWKALRNEMDQFLNTEVEHLETAIRPKRTVMFKNMLQHMLFNTQSSGKISKVEDMLLSMFREKESTAVFLMNKYGVDEYALKELAVQTQDSDSDDEDEQPAVESDPNKAARQKKTALEQFATNVTKLAADGLLDPVIGRDEETNRIIQILCRKRKNNPLLLGESGVGKCLSGNHEITIEVDDELYETIMAIA